MQLLCGHVYHDNCATQWFRRNTQCPLRCTPVVLLSLGDSVWNVFESAKRPQVQQAEDAQVNDEIQEVGETTQSGHQVPMVSHHQQPPTDDGKLAGLSSTGPTETSECEVEARVEKELSRDSGIIVGTDKIGL